MSTKGRTVAAAYDLQKEIEATKVLRAQFAELVAGDDEFAADLVEGETNLHDAIGMAIEQIAADIAAVEGIETFMKKMEARRDRHKVRADHLRTALQAALEQAGKKTFPHPLATLSLRQVPASVQVTDEEAIPAEFWKAKDPTLDKRAVLAALREKRTVPGATLNNGSQAISISWR